MSFRKATAIRHLFNLACLIVLTGLLVSAASAATFTYNGDVQLTDPNYPSGRPLASGACVPPVSLSAQMSHYNAFGFNVNTTGVYSIQTTAYTPSLGTTDNALFLYQNTFNPASPLTNLIAVGDSGGPCTGCAAITCATLNVGTRYILVTTPVQTGGAGTFTNQISHATGSVINPTAAPGIISGRITTPEGAPVAGVVMTLSGTRSAFTITDANGNYKFTGINTDAFYSLSPFRFNYLFTPSQLDFNLLADKTDAVFSGMPTPDIGNPIDTAAFFVRQQYLDFLGREADQGGLEYWTSELSGCGSDAGCILKRRNAVSAAFFKSAEFETTGSFVYRIYRAGLGRSVKFTEFNADRAQVLAGGDLEARKAAFALAFVQRAEFAQKYDGAQSAESFVDALLANTEQATGVNLSAQRASLINAYSTGGNLAESRSHVVSDLIEQAAFKDAVNNDSFVTMQYFGYLRRDPENGGRLFWVDVLNREPNNYLGMVCSFVTSAEYQKRFASVQTSFNNQCGQ